MHRQSCRVPLAAGMDLFLLSPPHPHATPNRRLNRLKTPTQPFPPLPTPKKRCGVATKPSFRS